MVIFIRAALAAFDASLVRTFAGIEIIRRMIGIAQLPAHFDLRTREDLLRTGARLALSG